jgi:hypothetical protein
MKHTLKALAAAGTFAVAAQACLAQSTVTLTSRGTITSGYDGLGLFVNPATPLAGLPFAMSLTLDITRLSGTRVGGENYVDSGPNEPMLATGEVTIAGHTYSWIIDHGSANAYLSSNKNLAMLSGAGTNMVDGWYVGAGGSIDPVAGSPRFVYGTDFGQRIEFHNYVNQQYNAGASFNVTLPYIPCDQCPGAASGPEVVTTQFEAASPDAVWTAASPVPEPRSCAMLLGGLAVLGFARRKYAPVPVLNHV